MAKAWTREQVAKYLRDFIEGTGSDYDWDDFTQGGRIADPELEAIRREAALIETPVTPDGFAKLRALLARLQP